MRSERRSPLVDRRRLRNVLDAARRLYPKVPRIVSVALLRDETIAKLHGEFLGDPTPTDVLAFDLRPGSPAEGFEAEIAIGVDVAVREARKRRRPLRKEVEFYLAHGLLHLAGFDDGKPSDRARMRRAERRVLRRAQEEP